MASRDQAIIDFQEKPGVNILIVSLKAAALGLNLVAANHVVLLDLVILQESLFLPKALQVCLKLTANADADFLFVAPNVCSCIWRDMLSLRCCRQWHVQARMNICLTSAADHAGGVETHLLCSGGIQL